MVITDYYMIAARHSDPRIIIGRHSHKFFRPQNNSIYCSLERMIIPIFLLNEMNILRLTICGKLIP